LILFSRVIVWIPIDRRHQASTPSKIQARAGDLDRSSPPVDCRVRREADYRPETNLTPFATIRARAIERKGGSRTLTTLLPRVATRAELTALPDDRILGEMTKRIFCSGFAWTVVEQKWPGFEAAFLAFDPAALLIQPPDFWDALTGDTRIVRHGQKVMAVAHNARFVADVSANHGGFGRFLAEWPANDQVGLLQVLAKQGARLGGNTGQYFLRFLGRDGFMLSRDVVLCLRDAGLDVAETPTSKRDLAKIQAQFNAWAAETKLPYTHLSRICAMSTGENHPAERLRHYMSE
jgi:3-methyladenine DNA glycosylase Tag